MNCLNWLQLKDSSNKVAIVVIVIVLALLIFVGFFSYNKAVKTVLGSARAKPVKSTTDSNEAKDLGESSNTFVRQVAPGVFEMNQSSKAKVAVEDASTEESTKMVFSVA